MAKSTRFEKKNNTGKGFFNLKAVMASGKKKKLGSILDYDKLSATERALLMKLVDAGDEGKSITIIVEYNVFEETDDAEDDFA